MKNQEYNPITILIAAMGGEGGGVLMNWIVNTAMKNDYPVQATSIPGVAQRTGATTYYIELLPIKRQELDGKVPIFSLYPAAGEVDIMVATELLEAARAVSNGFVTDSRTTFIVSNHRVFSTQEKLAAGDGRFAEHKLSESVKNAGKRNIITNFKKVAEANRCMLNAVLMGAVAGIGDLPMTSEAFETSIRSEGKAVASNLKGFQAGLSLLQKSQDSSDGSAATVGFIPLDTPLSARIQNSFPEAAQAVMQMGVARLIDYQSVSYADTYLERLTAFKDSAPELCSEVAKKLAVRMSYEDIIKVAQAKTRSDRLIRIRNEVQADADDLVYITEYFKPGIPEFCDMLPPVLSRPVLRWAERTNRLQSTRWQMNVKTTTLTGFLKLKFLAKLKWWRPRSYRWSVEQKWIDEWLQLILEATKKDVAFALEAAELSRLIKGYGSTFDRGLENYRKIVQQFTRPYLEGKITPENPHQVLRRLLNRALANPESNDLDKVLEQIE